MDAIRTEGLTKHYTKGFWRSRPYAAPRQHVALVAMTTQPVVVLTGVWACSPRVDVIGVVES